MLEAPVFHVNGDDPEAVVKVAEIATRYRQEFNSDVFIDMVCYRKHGHNEGDDPKYTQPQLYALIDKHPNPREVYSQKLISNGSRSSLSPNATRLVRGADRSMRALMWLRPMSMTRLSRVVIAVRPSDKASVSAKIVRNSPFAAR